MAVELLKFINEQLGKLPADNPDINFLNGIRRQTQAYMARRTSYPTLLGGGFHIAEYFAAARVGSYLDAGRIEELLNNPVLTDSAVGYGRYVLQRIGQEGNDSTAHLCLPRGILNALQRSGVVTIPQLREKLPSVGRIHNIGSFSYAEIIASLNTFDRLSVEVEATNRPVL